MPKFNKRTLENVHKLVYLANEYPEHNIIKLSQLFQTSPIDFNVAAWAARDLGYIEIGKDNGVTIKKLPEKWEFGELISHLLEVIPYAIKQINSEEADIEDNYLGSWTAGYPAHDVMIATRYLVNTTVLARYEVENKTEINPNRAERRKGAVKETIVDTYTFYTLPKNLKHRWGEKQFDSPERLK